MSYINTRLLVSIPEYLRKAAVFYPDILLFQHDRVQYEAHWNMLSTSKYLYTNGVVIKPTNWFYFTLQSIKGYFGFENHCKTEKIQLSLQKLAYYGYLKGYPQNLSMTHFPLDERFQSHAVKPRNDESTQYLQMQMMNYYFGNSAYFTDNEPRYRLPQTHFFGLSWGRFDEWREIPALDPQNRVVLIQTIERLKTEFNREVDYAVIRPSQFVASITQFYLSKAKLEKQNSLYDWPRLSDSRRNTQYYLKMALFFQSDCCLNELPLFIDYYLELKDYKQAYDLIEKLPDSAVAVQYLLKHFKDEQLELYVPKNSALSRELASHYLKQNGRSTTLHKASKFMDDLTELSPEKSFIVFVERKEFDKAYEVFGKYRNTLEFSKSNIKILFNHFDAQGDAQYKEGRPFRSSQNWEKAHTYYLNSMISKIKASHLLPSTESKDSAFAHQRLYAQLLIHIDIETNPVDKMNIESVKKAINLLYQCKPTHPEEKKLQQKALVRGLMRYADHHLNQIKVPLMYSRDSKARISHIANHSENFAIITTYLQRVIDLLDKTDDPEQKLILGKAHFILGDMNHFFDKGDYKHHFESAAKAVPTNPFYLLRVSEQFAHKKEAYRDRAVPILKSLGHSVQDYMDWDGERWEKDPIKGSIDNIHELKATKEEPKRSFFGL